MTTEQLVKIIRASANFEAIVNRLEQAQQSTDFDTVWANTVAATELAQHIADRNNTRVAMVIAVAWQAVKDAQKKEQVA